MGMFLAVASLAVAGAFFGGYLLQSAKLRAPHLSPDGGTSSRSAARDAALSAIDEAIRAKHEKRAAGALAALDRARRADPSIPGIDAAFAELALNEKQFTEMRTAADAAKKKGDHAAAASVLLGMDKWMNRGASDREISAAADAASGHFQEATEEDFFDAPAWFFWGDVLRYAGRGAEGRDRALAALHRFNPWDSSDVIAAKIVFASAEAGGPVFTGFGVDETSRWMQAVRDFAHARRSGGGDLLQALGPFAAQTTLISLSADPVVRVSEAGPAFAPPLPQLP